MLWACQIVVIAAGLGLSLSFLRAGLHALDLAWPITNPEGAFIAAILRVRDGAPLYQDFHQYPYVIAPYPPVQSVVGGLVSRALGLDVLGTMAAARGMTLTASLATAALVWMVARMAGASRLAALAGASLLLGLPFVDEWGYAVRPDLPALALVLFAALLLQRWPDRAWLSATVAVLAFFTKQTAVAFPVAAVLWLLLSGRRRGAFVFTGIWFGAALGGIMLLQVATGGVYILNTVSAHLATPKNGLDFAFRDIQPLVLDGWLPLGLALGGAVLMLYRKRRPELLVLYLLIAVGVAFATLRNTGSDVNYLIEPAAAACGLAALAIDALWGWPVRRPLVGTVAAVLLAVVSVAWATPLADYWHEEGGIQTSQRLPIEELAEAGMVLSEEPLAVVLAGRPLVVSDTFHISQMATTGFFDTRDLERRIKRSEFDLIVLRGDVAGTRWWKRQPLWAESLRIATKDVYVPAGRVGPFWLYEPEERHKQRKR
ncbi:MAG: glycosyltransferase family 39 protein [Chloroflexi bacterium]|nr:glycosyltransferase family 39 protein [Chloroflexota bacterium]